jgi:uncharacterized membrane protein
MPAAWSPTEAVGFAWNAVMQHFADIALPLAVGVFVMGLPAGIVNGLRTGLITGLAASGSVDADTLQLINVLTAPFTQIVNVFAQAFMFGGLFGFVLKALRGQKPAFGEVFSGGRFFVSMLGAGIVASIAYVVGIMLCVVPGIIVAIGLSLYPVLITDRQLGAIDSLKESWRLTTGHKVNLFIYGILIVLIMIAGFLACCLGALLVSAPIAMISLGYIYLKLVGEQPTLAQ